MISEYSFSFADLNVDLSSVIRVLGYDSADFPEPFKSYLEQAVSDCKMMTGFRGAFLVKDKVEMGMQKDSVYVDGVNFQLGRTIFHELKGSDRMAFFVCTAGQTISEKSSQLLHGDDPVLGYIYDVLGSAIAEAVGDQVQQMISLAAGKEGWKITNRYSPGYCHWDVADQHKLFSLFGQSACGVTLTPSALMNPVKSISGIIGIGEHVVFRDYQCGLCKQKNCVYREKRRR